LITTIQGETRMNRFVLSIALAASVVAFAQEKKTETRTFNIKVDAPMGHGPGDHMFVAAAPGPTMQIERFAAAPRKGAPYSAEAVNESVQTLADGNRIVNKNTSRMFRDAEGRTRMENTIAPGAMWVPKDGDFSITLITDPVAGVHYTLNNREKTATKITLPTPGQMKTMTFTTGDKKDGKEVKIEQNVVIRHAAPGAASGAGAGPMPAHAAGPAVMVFDRREGFHVHLPPGGMKTDDLGTQTIEGVLCKGTRETFTIPAGQMGNEREIRIVTERWNSADLGFDVLRKHSDPRSGETTYRVTRIIRADQPKSLFEPPADYKLEDIKSHAGKEQVIIHKKEKI
jgi:hypothetical protein